MKQIKYFDARQAGLVGFAQENKADAKELLTHVKSSFGVIARTASKFLLPWADKKAKNWLERTKNPYLDEIDALANILDIDGIYALNLSYEWGCTSGVFQENNQLYFFRTLDWPFAKMGEYVTNIHQAGEAGDFYNLSWPGGTPVIQAYAPNRFAACINQAPMRMHGLGFVGDWIKNRKLVDKETGLPPAHLLRKVFETAENYEQAKSMLSQEKICIPVIYVLGGQKPGEGCIIERTEDNTIIRELNNHPNLVTSNRFLTDLQHDGKGWRPRLMECAKREYQLSQFHIDELMSISDKMMDYPMVNDCTKLIMAVQLTTGKMTVKGIENRQAISMSSS